MSTQDNLANAFAGESQANRKYLAFAKKAEDDGFPQVAKLFKAAAAAETVHAHAHLRAMGGIKTTAENLQAAVEGEGFEFQQMYPPYIQEAVDEEAKPAEISFKNACTVEETHHHLYKEALAAVTGGNDLTQRRIFICVVCGNTVYDEAPDTCGVCGISADKFTEVP